MRLSAIAILLACSTLSAASLDEVLARMDQAAAGFHGVKADVEYETYTAVINDRSVEQGRMWMTRRTSKPQDVRVHIEFTNPDPRHVGLSGAKAEMYLPKINTVNEYDLRKQGDLVEKFLRFSFGTPGKDLAKDYDVKLVGEDEISGQKAAKLELVPKSAKARERLLRVELWVADTGGYPLRQKLYWPSGDTHTITYSDVVINPNITDAELALPLPQGVKRAYPGR